jgi:hypothetical protein
MGSGLVRTAMAKGLTDEPLTVLLGCLRQWPDLDVQWSSNMVNGLFRVDLCRDFSHGDHGCICNHLMVVADNGKICVEDYVGANGLVGGQLRTRDWVSGTDELLAVVGRVSGMDLVKENQSWMVWPPCSADRMSKVHVLVIQGHQEQLYEVEVFQTKEALEARQAEYKEAVVDLREQAKAKIDIINEIFFADVVHKGIELSSLADAVCDFSVLKQGELFLPVEFVTFEREVRD